MRCSRFLLSLPLLSFSLVSQDILAADLNYFVEAKYALLNGKATSYTDTADDVTQFPSINGGVILNKYQLRLYAEYSPVRWEDAEAGAYFINVDYLGSIDEKLSWYAGAGGGLMKFKADQVENNETKNVFKLQVGVNYQFEDGVYLTAGIRYQNNNSIRIQDNEYVYSELENLLGSELGFGLRF